MARATLLEQKHRAIAGDVDWDEYFDNKVTSQTIGHHRWWVDKVAASKDEEEGAAAVAKGLKNNPCCVVSTRFANEVKIQRKKGKMLGSYLLMSKLMSYAITRLDIAAYNPNDQNVSTQHEMESKEEMQARKDGRWLWIFQCFCLYSKKCGGVMVQLIPQSSNPKFDGFSDMMKAERNLANLLGLPIVAVHFKETDSEEKLKEKCAKAMPEVAILMKILANYPCAQLKYVEAKTDPSTSTLVS